MCGIVKSLRSALLLFLGLGACSIALANSVACRVQEPDSDPAAQAFAQAQYPKAMELYAAEAKKDPKDLHAIAGQVRSLLKEQQVDAAAEIAENTAAQHPDSAELRSVLGDVRFRQGRLADAYTAYRASALLDPCLAQNRYELYRLLRVESMRRSAYSELAVAHQLSPDDPHIHLAWIRNLPLAERAEQLKSYLAERGDGIDHRLELTEYSERLQAVLAAGHASGCQVTPSSPTVTTLPFHYILRDAYRFSGMGFEVVVNNKSKVLLELDTGASGILLNRGTAKKAGLVPLTSAHVKGLGDQKAISGYWAYADDLRIGAIEFRNCMVEVSDKRSVANTDGLIGADVFENYLVDLDFPKREMSLSPLPLQPGEAAGPKGSLNAVGLGNAAAASAQSSSGKPAAGQASSPIRYTDRYVSPEMQTWSRFARFGHQILINGQLKDNSPRLFLVDSGANVSVLSIAAAKSVGKIHHDTVDRVAGLSGTVKDLYTASAVDLMFAGIRDPLHNVIIMDLSRLSSNNGTEVSGIVGLDTLKMLTVEIDYRDGLIHLVYDPTHGSNVYNQFTH